MEVNGGSKHFMAFGGGMRFCVGTDFTKMQMAVFLHCLVTKYRQGCWTHTHKHIRDSSLAQHQPHAFSHLHTNHNSRITHAAEINYKIFSTRIRNFFLRTLGCKAGKHQYVIQIIKKKKHGLTMLSKYYPFIHAFNLGGNERKTAVVHIHVKNGQTWDQCCTAWGWGTYILTPLEHISVFKP